MKVLGIIALGLIAASTSAFAAADTFPVLEDTTIISTLSSANCIGGAANSPEARIGRETASKNSTPIIYRYVLRFDLSTIPRNSIITSATLGLNVSAQTASGNFPVDIRRLTQPGWKDVRVNWKAYVCDADPARALLWCQPGGDIAATDGVSWMTSGIGDKEINIAPLVQKAVGKAGVGARADTGGQLHLLINASGDTAGETRQIVVRTYEYVTNPPRIAVIWTPPAATANPWVSFRDETAQRLATGCAELAPRAPLSEEDRMEKDIATGDFDQDGDEDVIVARRDPFEVSTLPSSRKPLLLLNDGGALVDRSNKLPDVVSSARDVFAGDLDGDSRIDIAFATTCNDIPRFYRNRGGVGSGWLGFEDNTAAWEPARPSQPRPKTSACG